MLVNVPVNVHCFHHGARRRLRRAVGAVLLASAASQAAGVGTDAQRDRAREAVSRALLSVIERSPLKNARVSVQVRSLDDGSIIFARDAEELLNPASNVKLFTAAAALAKLGPDYRFDTEFLTESEPKDGRVKVLFVKGKGDPTITTERLYAMVAELAHAGLKEVQGDLVLDESAFDAQRQAPGYDQETGDRAYLAPTGAVSLNWNTVGVYLRPGETIGSRAAAEVEPSSDYFVVDARLVTGTRTQRRYTVSSAVEKDRLHQRIEVRGVVPWEKGTWSVWKKIDSPALYFGATLKELLKQRGIKVKGRVKVGQVPPIAKAFMLSQSDTLDIVLKKLNKHSSNFVAEQLIKTLGLEFRGAPGSTEKGISVVEDFLATEVGLPRGSFVMKNGSGLNDSNRFSAAQTNRLLASMMARFPLMPEYLSSLGIAGRDGTLKYRFEGSEAVGRLRAKTGTLENVSALSGYVQAVGGERFVFSVMVNDFPGRAGAVVTHIDALGAAVAAAGSASGPGFAVASITAPPTLVGPYEELKARLTTYVAFAQKADRRNAPFLRTAWRSEKDPAVRAVIADALYQSDPREPSTSQMLLESALPSDDVYGRLRRASKDAQLEVPVVGSLVELAAAGNVDAIGRLFEMARASTADELESAHLAEQLAVVASDAPVELLQALRQASDAERGAAVDALVLGVVRAARPDFPLWAAIKEAQGSPDPGAAEFARRLDVTFSQAIAKAKEPAPPGEAPVTAPGLPAPTSPTAAGGG